jgi:putative serine protease PepD
MPKGRKAGGGKGGKGGRKAVAAKAANGRRTKRARGATGKAKKAAKARKVRAKRAAAADDEEDATVGQDTAERQRGEPEGGPHGTTETREQIGAGDHGGDAPVQGWHPALGPWEAQGPVAHASDRHRSGGGAKEDRPSAKAPPSVTPLLRQPEPGPPPLRRDPAGPTGVPTPGPHTEPEAPGPASPAPPRPGGRGAA